MVVHTFISAISSAAIVASFSASWRVIVVFFGLFFVLFLGQKLDGSLETIIVDRRLNVAGTEDQRNKVINRAFKLLICF